MNDKAAADVASSTCAMPGWCGGSRGARMAKVRCASRCWAFVPEPTVGGRAMGAGWSAALQRQSRHQSLPPHVLCMPASGSVSLVGHLRCSAPSSCSMRGSCGKPRRPSESPQQRACSGPAARVRARRRSRAILYDRYVLSAPFVRHCLCAVQPERARSVPKQAYSVSYTSCKTLKTP